MGGFPFQIFRVFWRSLILCGRLSCLWLWLTYCGEPYFCCIDWSFRVGTYQLRLRHLLVKRGEVRTHMKLNCSVECDRIWINLCGRLRPISWTPTSGVTLPYFKFIVLGVIPLYFGEFVAILICYFFVIYFLFRLFPCKPVFKQYSSVLFEKG